MTLLQAASAIRDRDASALEALGTGLVLSGAPQEGLRFLWSAVHAGPDQTLYRNSLAAGWWNVGAEKKSVQEIERAIALEPLLESAYHMLARVNLALENRAAARSAWMRLLAHRPGLIFARKLSNLLFDQESASEK